MSEANYSEKTSAAAETAIKSGADAFKAGFDKAVQTYDAALSFGKENVEAVVKSATVAGKGAETIHNEFYAYSKQSIEDSITASKAILGSKSIHEAFELQTDFAKNAFETYVGQMARFGELFSAAGKDSFAPLQTRVQAWVDATSANAV